MLLKFKLNKQTKNHISNKHKNGFTLIEVLISISIFAIMATTLYSSFNLISSKSDYITLRTNNTVMAKNCIWQITEDLSSVYVTSSYQYRPPENSERSDPYKIFSEIESGRDSEFHTLFFASMRHIAINKKSEDKITNITYYVDDDPDGGFLLKRRDAPDGKKEFLEKKPDPVLCKNIKSIKFTFFDNKGDTSDFWDSDSEGFGYSTPSAVGIKLELQSRLSTVYSFETTVELKSIRHKKDQSYK